MKKIYVLLSAMLFGAGTFAQQGNDCATAGSVTPGGYTATTLVGAGASNGCFGSGGTDAAWYSFVPTCDGTITVTSTNDPATTDTRLSIYDGTCGALNCVASDDDGGTGFTSTVSNMPVTGGTTYYIEWDDRWSGNGFQWELNYFVGGIPVVGVGNATVSNLSFSAGDVSWTAAGAETAWVIEYGISGFTPGSGTVMNVSGAPTASITGLNPESTYDVYITLDPADPCGFPVLISFTTLPLCPMPINPSVVPGALDAVLSWNQGGAEVLWDVEYGAAGFILGSGTLDNNLAVMNDNLTGLTGSTNYHWYVRSVCDVNTTDGVDTVSLWVGPEAFTTVPTCAQPTGLNATVNTPNDADLNWTAGLETEWEIEYGMSGFAQGAGTSSVTLTNPTNVSGLTANTSYDYYVRAICAPGDTSAWSGPFTFMTPISCFDPTGLGISNLTTTSVDMNWTAGGVETEWMIEYGMNGFVPGSGTSMNVTPAPTANITGLTAGTDYSFYVQSVCGVGDSSMWVGPFNFTTVISCPEPTNLGAINITNTAANLIWQAGGSETDWNVEWGSAGFTPGNGEEFGSVANTTDNPYYATGLNSSSTYEYYVQASCGAGDMSTWAGPFTFNTLLANDMPCDAIMVTVDAPDTNQYNNFGATVDANEMSLLPANETGDATLADVWFNSSLDNSVWFTFTAPTSGNVIVSTASDNGMTNFNTDMAVYSATDCGLYSGYTILGANTVSDQANTNGAIVGSEIVLCGLTAGNIYYVLVDGYLGSTGNFMIAVNSQAAVDAGTAVGGNICSTDGSVELFDAITGNSDGNGTWYYPSVSTPGAQTFTANNGSMALTGLDFGVDYPFDYVVGSGCNMDVVSVVVNLGQQPNAGGDGSVTTCVNHDVVLIQELTGSVDFGGTWSDDDNATGLVNGILYPALVTPGTYNFSYVVDNGACSDTSVVAVTVDACLGVEENNNASLEVYPNPVQDVLTIANLNVVGTAVITLVDVQGKIVYTKNITDLTGNFQLDLSDFENGVYIVEITSDSNTQKVRVVKH